MGKKSALRFWKEIEEMICFVQTKSAFAPSLEVCSIKQNVQSWRHTQFTNLTDLADLTGPTGGAQLAFRMVVNGQRIFILCRI